MTRILRMSRQFLAGMMSFVLASCTTPQAPDTSKPANSSDSQQSSSSGFHQLLEDFFPSFFRDPTNDNDYIASDDDTKKLIEKAKNDTSTVLQADLLELYYRQKTLCLKKLNDLQTSSTDVGLSITLLMGAVSLGTGIAAAAGAATTATAITSGVTGLSAVSRGILGGWTPDTQGAAGALHNEYATILKDGPTGADFELYQKDFAQTCLSYLHAGKSNQSPADTTPGGKPNGKGSNQNSQGQNANNNT